MNKKLCWLCEEELEYFGKVEREEKRKIASHSVVVCRNKRCARFGLLAAIAKADKTQTRITERRMN